MTFSFCSSHWDYRPVLPCLDQGVLDRPTCLIHILGSAQPVGPIPNTGLTKEVHMPGSVCSQKYMKDKTVSLHKHRGWGHPGEQLGCSWFQQINMPFKMSPGERSQWLMQSADLACVWNLWPSSVRHSQESSGHYFTTCSVASPEENASFQVSGS